MGGVGNVKSTMLTRRQCRQIDVGYRHYITYSGVCALYFLPFIHMKCELKSRTDLFLFPINLDIKCNNCSVFLVIEQRQ